MICTVEPLPVHTITIDFDYFNSQTPQAGSQAVPYCSKTCSPCSSPRSENNQCSDKCICFWLVWGQFVFFIAAGRGCLAQGMCVLALNGCSLVATSVLEKAGTWSGRPSEIWLCDWLPSQSLALGFQLFTYVAFLLAHGCHP